MRIKLRILMPALFASLLPPALHAADDAATRGYELAKQVADSDKGYGDEVVTGRLTIQHANGSKALRVFRMQTLEKVDGGDKRAVVFMEPRDLAGFVSLNHSGLLEPDLQWIYLPQLNRTRRLSARDRSGSFAGSEFSFEEIVRWELEKYNYRHVESQPCGAKKPCEVLENIPKFEHSSYSKLVESINMDILQPRKIVYYNLAGKPFKELELSDYEQVGRFWRPRKMRMSNLESGAISDIEWGAYEFKTGLKDADFNVENITRWAR